MIPPHPRSKRTDTFFPYTPLFRSLGSMGSGFLCLLGFRMVPLPKYTVKATVAHPATKYRQSIQEIRMPVVPRVAPSAPLTIKMRSEEHTSELQSLMRISYAVFCLKKKKTYIHTKVQLTHHIM